jgi:D-alanyl-D-alanine carboxypeptidase
MKQLVKHVPFTFLLLLICLNCLGQQKDDYSAKLDSLLQTTTPRKFNGVILITKKGNTKYARAFGYSNIENKIPLTIKDNFRIQSNSKQVTAVLILKVVEKGKIDLHSPIKKYLPNLQQTWADTVTVHQLLNMSSGIVALDKPVRFIPGTGFYYSNPAYGLLGKILENVEGERYPKLVANLFKELGMHNSYCFEIGKTNMLVNGYNQSKEGFKLVDFSKLGFTEESWANFIATGGIISNAGDLLTWDTKLHNGKLLKPALYELMINSKIPDLFKPLSDEQIAYGYGINIVDEKPAKYFGHGGRGIGFTSMKFYVPQKKLNVIVLENVFSENVEVHYHFEKVIREIVFNSNLMK